MKHQKMDIRFVTHNMKTL